MKKEKIKHNGMNNIDTLQIFLVVVFQHHTALMLSSVLQPQSAVMSLRALSTDQRKSGKDAGNDKKHLILTQQMRWPT